MKFRTKLIVAGSAICLVSLSLLSTLNYRALSKEVESSISTMIDLSMKQVADNLSETMKAKYDFADYLSELTATAPQESVHTIFNQSALNHVFVTAGVGYEDDGRIVHNDASWTPPSDWDSRTRPWYVDAKRVGQRVVTEPYVDEGTGAVLISVSQPIYQSGQLEAVSFFDVDLSVLSATVNEADVPHSTLFIVHENGTIIGHPNAQFNGQPLTRFIANGAISNDVKILPVNGRDYYVTYQPVPHTRWFVGILVDFEQTHLPLQNMRTSSMIIATLLMFLSLAVFLAIIAWLTRPLRQLSAAMDNVASGDGDLTKRLDTNTDEEFSQLAKSFNNFVATIQALIKDSQRTAHDVTHVAESTNIAANDSRMLLDTQVQEVEQLATAMNEMSTTCALVAENAQSAAHAAQSADHAAEEGTSIVSLTSDSIQTLAQQMERASKSVRELEASTDSIESIVSVINGIADQTNLLALNAAIEAARAGDSGRGFAVVADEVRTLAQRTTESTTEIRAMIERLQAGANTTASAMTQSYDLAMETVEHAHSANESLHRIKDAVSQITEMNIQIASAAEEQSLVAEEINGNTVNIKDLSSQVAERTLETSNLVEQQTRLVEEQSSALNKFIV